MNQGKVIRAVLLAQADEMGILDKVKAHEARLAARFIQQPTEEDLAAYGLALALVGSRASELMANAEPQVKAGEVEPAPIEVDLQPTTEMIAAALKEANENGLTLGAENEDLIVFMWQAMIGARPK
ncbi:hypothetical protein [Phage ST231]|nr:hypothetical protein [Phage ST231]